MKTTYRVIDRTAPRGVFSQEFDTIDLAHAAFMSLVRQKKECAIREWPSFKKIEEYIPE